MEFWSTIAFIAVIASAYKTFQVYQNFRLKLKRKDVNSLKVHQNNNVAQFVRADGRIYLKYYDEYGSAGSTAPTLLPWARLSHPEVVRYLNREKPELS